MKEINVIAFQFEIFIVLYPTFTENQTKLKYSNIFLINLEMIESFNFKND